MLLIPLSLQNIYFITLSHHGKSLSIYKFFEYILGLTTVKSKLYHTLVAKQRC